MFMSIEHIIEHIIVLYFVLDGLLVSVVSCKVFTRPQCAVRGTGPGHIFLRRNCGFGNLFGCALCLLKHISFSCFSSFFLSIFFLSLSMHTCGTFMSVCLPVGISLFVCLPVLSVYSKAGVHLFPNQIE